MTNLNYISFSKGGVEIDYLSEQLRNGTLRTDLASRGWKTVV